MWCSGGSTGGAAASGLLRWRDPGHAVLARGLGGLTLALTLVAAPAWALPEALSPAAVTLDAGASAAGAASGSTGPAAPSSVPGRGLPGGPSRPLRPPLPRPLPVPSAVPAPSLAPTPRAVPSLPPVCPPPPPPSPVPLYRLTGYDLRHERLSDADWARVLGPGRSRQYQASKWLLILGGATAFAGAVSLLVGLGNLAGQTDFGRRPADSTQPDFEGFVAGFGAATGVGGAALLTGAILSWSLPDRVRPLYVPRFQKEEPSVPPPATPAHGAPLSSFPNWAFVAPLGSTRAWIQ